MLGRGTKVRFVRAQKVEHGPQHGRIPQPGAKRIGSHPGQREQPLGPRGIGQHPAERGKRQRVGVSRGLGVTNNCEPRG